MKKSESHNEHGLKSVFPWVLMIFGIIGFVFSFVLMIEKIELVKDVSYQAPCNISPLLSCTSVMKTPQSEVFGFPNPLIGIAGFAVVLTVGIALLAGAHFKRWFWIGLEAGAIFGVGFVHWLFYQSVYVIGFLCPFCMVVWSVTIPIFLYTTLYNLREGYITTPQRIKKTVSIVQKYHISILCIWYMAIITAIIIHFWYYWSTLI